MNFIPYPSSLAGCLDAATPSPHGKKPCQGPEQHFPLLLVLAHLALATYHMGCHLPVLAELFGFHQLLRHSLSSLRKQKDPKEQQLNVGFN